jgi:hypothetical protein
MQRNVRTYTCKQRANSLWPPPPPPKLTAAAGNIYIIGPFFTTGWAAIKSHLSQGQTCVYRVRRRGGRKEKEEEREELRVSRDLFPCNYANSGKLPLGTRKREWTNVMREEENNFTCIVQRR